jgi:hypothetical protein
LSRRDLWEPEGEILSGYPTAAAARDWQQGSRAAGLAMAYELIDAA